jgi:predicted phosphoadenosine phosphosulfate sulfurtransferase
MKLYRQETVYEAAIERIRYLFNEFDEVIVSFSGGKDSTVTLQLTLQVAREMNRLPLKVVFLDQEAEWQAVVDYIRSVGELDGIDLWWFQMPLRLFNSASSDTDWLNCWAEGEEWMRPREPNAITVNRYGSDRFKELFGKISLVEWGNKRVAWVAGVRCEESPARAMGLTTGRTYKHITWGNILSKAKDHYTFYPLYDWSYTDIWKAIHCNGWKYCKIYDEQYRYGISVNAMRVSNLHHETSFVNLFYLQEIEKHTWEALCRRLPGVSTVGQLKTDAYACPKSLPSMFASWREYRDHLLKYICVNQEHQAKFQKYFKEMDDRYVLFPAKDEMYQKQIKSILSNDYHFTQLENWRTRPEMAAWRNWMKGKYHRDNHKSAYIRFAQQQGIQPAAPIQ